MLNLGARSGWGGGQRHAPAALPQQKELRYALYRKLCGPQGRSRRLRKISPSPGFDPPTVQPVVSRYTERVIPAAPRFSKSMLILCSHLDLVTPSYLSPSDSSAYIVMLFHLPLSFPHKTVLHRNLTPKCKMSKNLLL